MLSAKGARPIKNERRRWWVSALIIAALAVGVTAGASTAYMVINYYSTDIDTLLFYAMHNPTVVNATVADGTPFVWWGIAAFVVLTLPTLALTARFWPIRIPLRRLGSSRSLTLPRPGPKYAVFILVVCVSLLLAQLGVPRYVWNQVNPGQLYAERYVSPDGRVSPPAKPRNLVFIYVESLENTLVSRDHGGQTTLSLIPRMEEMALDKANVSFSNKDEGLGGALPVTGATWSLGAMTAMTSGVPLKPAIWNEMSRLNSFLPGARFQSEILTAAGYQQTFMVGANPAFGGIDKMFDSHPKVKVFGPGTAKSAGKIPYDYHQWWGFEDRKLFDYGREEAALLASSGQPFALTLFAEDTHPDNGYLDAGCPRPLPSYYDNVHLCATAMVADFVDWVKAQPFGPDTTIVVVGDHLNMQNSYITAKMTDRDYKRTTYNVIINSAVPTARTKGRQFTSLDMFPTTLAAMGFEIKGNRLGLGVNLFSDEKTLAEELGIDTLNSELARRSVFYDDVLMGGG